MQVREVPLSKHYQQTQHAGMAALQESEERFAKIFEKSPIPSSITKVADAKYTEVNSAWCNFFGFSKEEAIGHTVDELNIVDHATLRRLREFFTREGALENIEVVVYTKNGERKAVLVSVEVLLIGAEKYAIKMIVDITEQQLAAHKLKKSESKFRNLFHNHSACKLLIEPDSGNIVEANRAAEKFYGWSREQLLQMRIQDINTLSPEQVREEMAKAQKQQRIHFEFRHRTADGSIKDVEAFSSRLDVDGKTLLHSIIHDITERRLLEEQLLHAQKMEIVGQLAGGVAHDYNNMLSVILGYTELALHSTNRLDPRYEYLSQVHNAGKRSVEITGQLLAFARRQTIAPVVLDLNEVVEGMLKMLRHLIGENINLAWLPASGLWPVLLDPAQVNQILANLCVNARDAITGVGKVTIETGTVTFDETYCAEYLNCIPGEYVMLAVSDNGCGMAPETRDRIFEPFFTTKEVGAGTGLGLSTVYGIVRQNGGFINVYSKPDRGTTLKIYLSRYSSEAQVSKAIPIKNPPPGRGESVLVVEDELALLHFAQRILEDLGYDVLVAGTPEEAISVAQSHNGELHLLITDVVMPGMNGRDLSHRIHAIYPQSKTLFMSGYTENVIAHHGVLDDGIRFIQKPFTVQGLATKIRKTLEER
jgi:PAS domain S-box-containing protein